MNCLEVAGPPCNEGLPCLSEMTFAEVLPRLEADHNCGEELTIHSVFNRGPEVRCNVQSACLELIGPCSEVLTCL